MPTRVPAIVLLYGKYEYDNKGSCTYYVITEVVDRQRHRGAFVLCQTRCLCHMPKGQQDASHMRLDMEHNL